MNEAQLVAVTQKGMRGMECLVGPPTLLLLTQDGSKAEAEPAVTSLHAPTPGLASQRG